MKLIRDKLKSDGIKIDLVILVVDFEFGSFGF